jgi:hypothetical protein
MSEVKVNKISPRTNCGTTTLGDSGDTFTLPSGGTITIASGATITNQGTANGFGQSGSVNWQPGSIKTSDFTATAGEGYFVNTTGGAITVTLPTGSAGAILGFKDYASTWNTNSVTLDLAGTDRSDGSTTNPLLSTSGGAVTLVFVDATRGWLVTDDGTQSSAQSPEYVLATGGTVTNSPCGNFKIHKFTGPGTFQVTSAGNAAGSNSIDYLVVAGGGAGGYANGGGGGGGAGGLIYSATTYCNPTPCGGAAAPTGLPVAIASYPVTVGAGGGAKSGAPDYKQGDNGSNSVFAGTSTITAAGGGGGGGGCTPPTCQGANGAKGDNGGSGGGGGKTSNPGGGVAAEGGAGNTPPVSPVQGTAGGLGGIPNPNIGGGGGGHGTAGQPGCGGTPGSRPNDGGDGGAGSVIKIDNSCTAYAGGGGGQAEGQPGPAQGSGGNGGGGAGSQTGSTATSGTANTGGGGGGADSLPSGQASGAGGSGIVIIRYKFQN